ncbi:hypothetical protein [Nocardia goodfellowii]|uniref:Uncharacterized protein n=1 Tax=Nocardia goodfellowii TaxID=882446 RepID=A0ABS4Q8C2_9NOCA|nr:hypothetical protein [Nocardia goodfellowii]MBP2187942.1 hypothetical protein [Nocardia goodfellowii]
MVQDLEQAERDREACEQARRELQASMDAAGPLLTDRYWWSGNAAVRRN